MDKSQYSHYLLCVIILCFGCRNKVDVTTGHYTDPRDGETYPTVTLNSMTWLGENLRFATPSSVCYEHIDSNCLKYGRLYAYAEAQDACPPGWRLPTGADVRKLHRMMHSARIHSIAPAGEWNVRGHQHFSNDLRLSMLPAGRVDSFGFFNPKGEWALKRDFHQLGYAASFWLADTPEAKGVPHWHLGEPIGETKSGVHTHEIRDDLHKFSVRCVCESGKS